MKRNIFYILSVVLLFTSCTKWLDEENRTKYSSDYIYSTEGGLKLAVNAVYTLLRDYASDTENATIFALERGTDLAVTNGGTGNYFRSEEHTSELQSRENIVCRLLLEK